MRANPKDTTEPRHLVALWLHESSRVFEDRLTCEEDHLWFRGRQEALLRDVFGTSWGEVVGAERLIYGDYLTPSGDARVSEGAACGQRSEALGGRSCVEQPRFSASYASYASYGPCACGHTCR